MYISATAVIKQINSLESNLGLQLFDRTHRGLVLTKAGKSPVPGCKVHCAVQQRVLILITLRFTNFIR